MRSLIAFAIVILMNSAVSEITAAQTLPTPQAITDPKQITSKPNAQVEPRGLTIEKLYMTRQVGRATWSPDGKQIAFISNMSGRNNIWLVPADGGWPMQLTVSDQRQSAPAWSPDGKWIAYQSDYDGDELWDIFLVSPKTGKVVNLTSTREIAELNPTWSPDGRYLAYEVKPKTSAAFEIDIYDTLMREVKHLTTGTPQDKSNSDPIWSKDGKFVVYTQEQAKGTDSNIFFADVATGISTLLTPHEGEQRYSASDISPDGKRVLFTSNAANGYQNIGLLEISSHKISWLTRDKWAIHSSEFSPDGKHITFTANVDGNEDIYLHDLAAGKSAALPMPKGVNEPSGGHSGFTKDGTRLLYSHNGPTAPGDLWVYTLATGKSQQVTHSLVAGVNSEDMVEPYLVHYPSRDGKWTILCVSLCPFQHGAQRPERRYRLHSRRPYVADHEFLQPLRAVRRQSGVHGSSAQLSRVNGLRKRVPAGKFIRHGRRRFARRSRWSRLDQADRPSRSKENRRHGRQLWRLSQHDGRHKGTGPLGRGRTHRAFRQLVHRNRE